jgi:hypothetical protein
LIAGVTTFRLLYADADGRPTTDLTRLSRVRIEVQVGPERLVTTEVRIGGGGT